MIKKQELRLYVFFHFKSNTITKGLLMFEELIEKINKIEANVNLLLELHLEQTNNLTTYNDVAKFLGVTRKTIYNYVKNQKLTKGLHYYTNDKGTPTFIPSEIIEFKKGVKAVDIKPLEKLLAKPHERVNNPIVSSMLVGVA